MAAPIRKKLLVEGQDDLYAIVQLMASHVTWGKKPQDWPVLIEAYGGVEKILASGSISVELKSPKIDTLGIVVDADEDFAGRWQRLRSLCGVAARGFLPICRRTGLSRKPATANGSASGSCRTMYRAACRTFLRFLVPEPEEPIWLRAQEAVAGAVADGAKCRPHHVDKIEHLYLDGVAGPSWAKLWDGFGQQGAGLQRTAGAAVRKMVP